MTLRLALAAALVATLPSVAAAQPSPSGGPDERAAAAVARTPAAARLAAFAAGDALDARSVVANVPFRSLGPTVMSGRVADVEGAPDDPATFYVAFASGGLWRTTSNGAAFEPLFDAQPAITIGDFAVDWSSGTLWVGTGESNASRSSYAGTGVYRSTDGGVTWALVGLPESHHVARVLVHPEDGETVWVASLGPLYSPGGERGVYKTTDGGRTWRRTLAAGPYTGAADLVLDPTNPDRLLAATWTRTRRAWDFTEAGAGSGVWRSEDGGETWARVGEGSGFPQGVNVGRIGLAVYPGDPSLVYAVLDNQARRPPEDDAATPALTKDALRTMSRAQFLELTEEALTDYLDRNGFPLSYTVQSLQGMVREGEIEPVALVEFLEDANAQRFETPVVGAEVYRSADGGRTWARAHEGYLDDLFYSFGYYFGQVRVAPDDPDRVYVLGVPLIASSDGGATWAAADAPHVHVDHHALWLNPRRPGHLISGNDGGVNVSFDGGRSWAKANVPAVGQFYTAAVDRAEPYRVYGGLQDNGVWRGPSTYEAGPAWRASGDYPYEQLLGGDGMQVAVDPRTNDTVYTGFQFGHYFRVERESLPRTGSGGDGWKRTRITPEHALGERPLRFNWQTPLWLSAHNPDILYLGSQRLHRSLDRGETWEALSGDLTGGGRPGDVPYGTLTSVHESPRRFGLLAVGSDDGRVHVSEDGGHAWRRADGGLPDGVPDSLWVSRVRLSHHDEDRVYLALNGYRWDHFEAYCFRSDDLGRTWTRIGEDLPAEPVNVLLEDPENADVLYVGTDNGLYVSLDRGASFQRFMGPADSTAARVPNAPVHDLAYQPDAHELVVATHGRSLWAASVEHVQRLTGEMLRGGLRAFDVPNTRWEEGWGGRPAAWLEVALPEVTIPYFAPRPGQATITVTDSLGTLAAAFFDEAERGLNYARYDLTAEDPLAEDHAPAPDGTLYLLPGTYTVEVALGDEAVTTTLTVESAAPKPPRGRKKTP